MDRLPPLSWFALRKFVSYTRAYPAALIAESSIPETAKTPGFAKLNWRWLKILKNSVRNCTKRSSLKWKLLKKLMSKLVRWGDVRVLRPTVLKAPTWARTYLAEGSTAT